MLEFTPLQELDLLDELIYQNEGCFTWDRNSIKEKQLKLIKENFLHHYTHNESYRGYCSQHNFTPDDINSYEDLYRIPLIPSTMFKLTDIITGNPDDVVKVCTSSGTKGSISKVYRDETTLNRFLGSLQSSVDQIYNIDDAYCINLGPSSKEAGDLWFSYAISVIDMVFPTENLVIEDVFYPDKAIQRINDVFNEYENIIIVGAPIMFMELMSYMRNHGISFEHCEKVFFVTAGGWKRFTGQSIPRQQFWQEIRSFFHNAKEENFRDTLNMVELNTILPECEHHTKHIVPWVKLIILSPVDLKPVPDGEVGLIAFLDPSAVSFPCFILTDDLGRIHVRDNCACGRSGDGLEIVRRVQSVESRGCALKIDRKYAAAQAQAR